MNKVEPQEFEALLQFYRTRYEDMSQNASVQERMLRELRSEVEVLKKELLKLQKG